MEFEAPEPGGGVRAERLLAVRLAGSVPGVRDVLNELTLAEKSS